MSNNFGETNAFLSGFKSAYRAYKWALLKPSLLILSILSVCLQLIQAILLALIVKPADFLSYIKIPFNASYIGLIQSLSIILFALVTFSILAVIQTIGAATIALKRGHKPYLRHDLIAAFSKIFSLGWYIPLYMGIILTVHYISSLINAGFLINIFWLILNIVLIIFVAYLVYVITFRQTSAEFGIKKAFNDLAAKSIEHIGAISFYAIWYAVSTFLSDLNNIKMSSLDEGSFISGLFEQLNSFLMIVLFAIYITIMSFLVILILFVVPAYAVYTALFYEKQQDEKDILENPHV